MSAITAHILPLIIRVYHVKVQLLVVFIWLIFTIFIGSIQEIQKHKMFMSVKESLQALFSCLKATEISVRVLKKAKKHKESLCDTFACLEFQTKNVGKQKFKIDRKVCKERIEKNAKFVEEYEAKLNAVQSAISISSYVSKKVEIEISDIKEATVPLRINLTKTAV